LNHDVLGACVSIKAVSKLEDQSVTLYTRDIRMKFKKVTTKKDSTNNRRNKTMTRRREFIWLEKIHNI